MAGTNTGHTYLLTKEVRMTCARILITLPQPIKKQLDSLRQEGFTTSGFIRAALEREFKQRGLKLKKGR